MAVIGMLLLLAWSATASLAAVQTMASARVSEVDTLGRQPVVVLDAGAQDGLSEGAEVTLLRAQEPIVHPLTGEVLGVPEEPVGIGRVFEVQGAEARARMVRVYSVPHPGDLVEYVRTETAAPQAAAVAAGARVEDVLARMQRLEQNVARSQQVPKQLARYPTFAREVWGELNSVRAYMVSIDERLLQLESLQSRSRELLDGVLRGERPAEETRQFTIRYDADTQVRVRVAGKTLIVDVEPDSLHLKSVATGSEATNPLLTDVPVTAQTDENAARTWTRTWTLDWSLLSSPLAQGVSLGVIALLGLVLYLLMRRRQRTAFAELEDLDSEYLEEEQI